MSRTYRILFALYAALAAMTIHALAINATESVTADSSTRKVLNPSLDFSDVNLSLGNFSVSDAAGVRTLNLGAVNGTKIGATGNKLAFFGATPILKPSGSLLAAAANLGLVASPTVSFSELASKPTNLAGYGITDAQPLDSDLTAIAALATTSFGRDFNTLADAAAARTKIDAAQSSHTHTFASLTSKPNTLDGYGITDAAASNHTHTFASLTSKPTTIAGFGITDAQPLDSDLTAIAALSTTSFGRDFNTLADAAAARTKIDAAQSNHTHTFASLTSKPTTIAGFGITDAQPLDSDLTAIAALSTTSFGRDFNTLADAAAARAKIGLPSSEPYINIRAIPGLALDGVTDDSAAFAAYTASIAGSGRIIFIPGDVRIKLGGAAQVTLNGVGLKSEANKDAFSPYGQKGGTILIAGAVSPFLVGQSWCMDGLIFFYPAQTEATLTAYPPMITGIPAQQCISWTFTNNQVINAYDLFDFSSNATGGFHITGNLIYAVRRVLTLGSMPVESWVTDNQFTYYAYQSVVNAPGAHILREYTNQNGEILRVTGNGTNLVVSTTSVDGLQLANNYTLGYRYGVHVTGGHLNLGKIFNSAFDGVAQPLVVDAGGKTTALQVIGGTWIAYRPDDNTVDNTALVVSGAAPGVQINLSGIAVSFINGSFASFTNTGGALSLTNCTANIGHTTGSTGPYQAVAFNSATGYLSVVNCSFGIIHDGGSGIKITAAAGASLVGDSLSGFATPIDNAATTGVVAVGCTTRFTTGAAAIGGTQAAAVLSSGNLLDVGAPAFTTLSNLNDIRPGGTPAAQTFLRLQAPNGGSIYGQQWNLNIAGVSANNTDSRFAINAGNNSSGSYNAQADVMSLWRGGGVVIGNGTTNPGANNLSVTGTSTVAGNSTVGGNLTISGSLQPTTYSYASLAYGSGTIDYDFAAQQYRSVVLTGAIALNNTLNRAGGRTVTIAIYNFTGASQSVFYANAASTSWHWISAKPSTLANNKAMLLKLNAFGTGETDVFASLEVQP